MRYIALAAENLLRTITVEAKGRDRQRDRCVAVDYKFSSFGLLVWPHYLNYPTCPSTNFGEHEGPPIEKEMALGVRCVQADTCPLNLIWGKFPTGFGMKRGEGCSSEGFRLMAVDQ